MAKDTVVWKQVGRAAAMPIASFPADAPGLSDLIAAVKQQHISDAVRSGAQIPAFRVESGTVDRKAPVGAPQA